MRTAGTVVVALVLALAWWGCGRKAAPPVAPPPSPVAPPAIVAMYPPARSTFIRYDTPCLWVRFAAPLDTATVNDRNIFLKIDDVRVPISVRWVADSNTVIVTPSQRLTLLTTYTVELSPNLATATGIPLGTKYWWQFTVNSLLVPGVPGPVPGARNQSPFASLSWRYDLDVTPGGVGYDLYVGPDSATVAARSIPRLARVAGSLYTPLARWPLASPNYWALTAVNYGTGERLDGPVWRFDTIDPAAARLDSLVIGAVQWGWASLTYRTRAGCRDLDFISGAGYKCGVLWQLSGTQALLLASASVVLWTTPTYEGAVPTDLGMLASTTEFATNCSFVYDGSPYVDEVRGRLATATFPAPRRVVFESDTLSSFVQDMMVRGLRRGFFLRSMNEVHYVSTASTEAQYRPTLTLRYYVPNP